MKTETLPFIVDAALIGRLGRELVQKQETALSELIKNAYDADATQVDVVFNESSQQGSTLEIRDNGSGMNRDDLINGFFRIASDYKVKAPLSQKYKRSRAGKKGIGRFSVQRLANELILETEQSNYEFRLQVKFIWESYAGDKDLHEITNEIHFLPKTGKIGTTLKLIGLRENWSDAQIKRTFRYVSNLIAPTPLSKNSKDIDDPGFKVHFWREIDNNLVEIASEEESILKHAMAVITAGVDSKGPWVSIKSERYDFSLEKERFANDERLNSSLLRDADFRLEAYYFVAGGQSDVYLGDDYPSNLNSFIVNYLRDNGGIKLFRNGFRVPPYGEKNNDWLTLDRSYARRLALPPHANQNFIGWATIKDDKNTLFEETASREGLLSNSHTEALSDFLYKSIIFAVNRIAELRKRKVYSGQSETESDKPKSPKARAKRLKDVLSKAKQKAADSGVDIDPNNELDDAIEAATQAVTELLNENALLRIHASVGLSIIEFSHELKNVLYGDNVNISSILNAVQKNEKSDLVPRLQRVQQTIDHLKTYTSFFTKMVLGEDGFKIEPRRADLMVKDFISYLSASAERKNVEIQFDDHGEYENWLPAMHPAEVHSILLNFYTNSLKAIKKGKNAASPKVMISVYQNEDRIIIDFADNGCGIPPENEERIFELYFSTTTPGGMNEPEATAQTGTGLGLKIVKDIIESHNGDVFVVPPPAGYTTCIRVELPKAEEIPEGEF